MRAFGRVLIALGLLAVLAHTGVVRAESLISSITAAQLRELMIAEGYTVSTTAYQDQLLWQINGYHAYLYVQGKGRIVKFHKGFSNRVSPQTVNAWNRTKRYSTSYVDRQGRANLKLYLSLDGGISVARLVGYLNTCRVSFLAWLRFLQDAQAGGRHAPAHHQPGDLRSLGVRNTLPGWPHSAHRSAPTGSVKPVEFPGLPGWAESRNRAVS